MAERKQVMDIRPNSDGVTKPESNEQQRNWTNNLWDRKAQDSLANYDPTRAHLNFEVTKGGKVQPIDTSKSISEKMDDILRARGIRNPNERENVRRKQRILAQMIFGGSRERMLEIAFGNQEVNHEKGANNAHLHRTEDIEKWAVDTYNFVARHFGEENIVSFYVHLDETNPHCHCTVLPIAQGSNRISWCDVFGKNPQEEKKTLTRLHSALYEEVGKHWGLERGSNKAETGAKHRSTEEYKRELVNEVQYLEKTKEGLLKQIHRAEIKLKGLSTMIANLQARKEKIGEEIELIEKQLNEGQQNQVHLLNRLAELRSEMNVVDGKIVDKKRMLDDTVSTLSAAEERLAELKKEHSRAMDTFGDDVDKEAAHVQANILSTYNRMVTASLEPLLPSLTEKQKDILQESGYNDLTDNTKNVITCAMLLALRYVKEATEYAQSCGGGGGGNMSGWGRDKDDDDEMWWRRCIAQSAAMVKPAGRKVKRSR